MLYELRVPLLLLRLAVMFLSIAALLVAALNEEDGFFPLNVLGSPQPVLMRATADFKLVKGIEFLIGAMGVAAGYSLLQLVVTVASLVFGPAKSIVSWNAWISFLGDMMISHLCASAAGSSAQLAYLGKRGAPMWSEVCSNFGHYCIVFGFAMVLCFLATVAAMVVASISAYHLFRLNNL